MSFSYNKRTNVASGVGDTRVSRILATTVDEKPIFLSIDALRGLVPDVDSRISGYIHNDDVDDTTRLLVGVSPSYRAISDYVDSQRDAVIGESGDQWTNDKTLYGLLQKMGVDIATAKSQITGDPADTAGDRTLWGLYNAIQGEGINISNIVGDEKKISPYLHTIHSNSRQLLSNSFVSAPADSVVTMDSTDYQLSALSIDLLSTIIDKTRHDQNIPWTFKFEYDINGQRVDPVTEIVTEGYGFKIIVDGTTSDGYEYQLTLLTTDKAEYVGGGYRYNNGIRSLQVLGFEVLDTAKFISSINSLLGSSGASASEVSIRGNRAKINQEVTDRQNADNLIIGDASTSTANDLDLNGLKKRIDAETTARQQADTQIVGYSSDGAGDLTLIGLFNDKLSPLSDEALEGTTNLTVYDIALKRFDVSFLESPTGRIVSLALSSTQLAASISITQWKYVFSMGIYYPNIDSSTNQLSNANHLDMTNPTTANATNQTYLTMMTHVTEPMCRLVGTTPVILRAKIDYNPIWSLNNWTQEIYALAVVTPIYQACCLEAQLITGYTCYIPIRINQLYGIRSPYRAPYNPSVNKAPA